jgi:hypothetical protein
MSSTEMPRRRRVEDIIWGGGKCSQLRGPRPEHYTVPTHMFGSASLGTTRYAHY